MIAKTNKLTGIDSSQNRQQKRGEPDDENCRYRVVRGGQAPDVFQDVKAMSLDNVI